MFLLAPLSVVAQDATSTPLPDPITVNLPPQQIVGTENPINLRAVAAACDPACAIGLEATYWVDPYNHVDENKALIVGFDRELHPTVPQGMSAVLFAANGENLLVPLASTDRAPQGAWVAAVFIQGEIPDVRIRIFNVVDPRCAGYNCDLPQFDGIEIFSTLEARCGSIQAPVPNSLVLYQAVENGPWTIEQNRGEYPSICGRFWIFVATVPTTTA
jgi:hypothetical protein